MEINLVTSSNIPDGSIFSIRVGAVHKQAPFTSKGPFCFAAGPMDSSLKVEVYKPVASEHVVMKPGEKQYNVMFTGPADEPQMSCEIHVKPLGGGTAATAPPAIEKMEPAGQEGSACTRKAKERMQSHLATKAVAVEAKEYLESHQVLEFIQALLQTVVKERPADPYAFLSRHFTSGYHPHGFYTPLPQDEPAWLERLLAAAGLPGLFGQAKEWLEEKGCRGTEDIRSGYPISDLVYYLIEHSELKSIPASRLWKAAKSVQEEEDQHAWLRRLLAAAELPELFGQAAKWVAETGYDINAGDCVSNLIDHLTKQLKHYPARRLEQVADMLEEPPRDQQDLGWLGSLLAAAELPELFWQSAAEWVAFTGCEQSDLRDGDGVEVLIEHMMLMEFQESRLREAAKSLQKDEFPWLRHLLRAAKLPQLYDQAAKWVARTGCKEYDIRGGDCAEGLIEHLKLKKFPARRLWNAAKELREDKLAWLRRLLEASELPQHFERTAQWAEENCFEECDVEGGDSVKDLIEHLGLRKFPASRLQKAAMQAARQAATLREEKQLAWLRRRLAAAELSQHFNQAAECVKEIGARESPCEKFDGTLIEELVKRLGLEELPAGRLEKAAETLEKEDELPWLRSLLATAELTQHFDQAAELASEWVFDNEENEYNSVHGIAESLIEKLIKHLSLEKIQASRLEKAAESLGELAWLRRLLAAAELPEPEPFGEEHFDVAARWVAETGCKEYDFRGGVITEALVEELIERLDLEKIPASRLETAAASMRVRLSLKQDSEEQHNQVAGQVSAAPQHTDGAKATALTAPEEGASSDAAEQAAEWRKRDAQIVEKRLLTPLQAQAAETAAAAVREEAARLEELPQLDRRPQTFSSDGTTYWDLLGGHIIDRLLRHTPLIEIGWLIALTEAGGVVPRNQDVPPEALITPRNAWRLRQWRNFSLPVLPVLVLSYPWLDWWHPDRLGAQLRRLLPVFKAFLKEARVWSKHGTVGVLMDFPCLPQKPFSSEEEAARFKASLSAINEWYFHPHTFVLLVTPSPPAADAQGYSNTRLHRGRGWCFFELAASMTAKNKSCLLDCGSYGGEGDLDGCISSMKRGRLPPICPTRFEEELRRRVQLEEREPEAADGLKFTAKADMELVIEQYRKGFVSTFEHLDKSYSDEHSAVCIQWTELGWGDEEGPAMLETCRYILKHCKLPGPIKLRCEHGNHFSQEMLKQLPHASSLSNMPQEFEGTFLRDQGDNGDLLYYWMSR